jgi:hypothetical protein
VEKVSRSHYWDGAAVAIAVTCYRGRHRSVLCAELAQHILQELGLFSMLFDGRFFLFCFRLRVFDRVAFPLIAFLLFFF